ncbi:MAG: hypothetical protein HZA37_00665 [Parcubacteria group bacterium]|nr:hypothetical protein [Parcubacteria group bacterium]
MIVGIPKETKQGEKRVGLNPKYVSELIEKTDVSVAVEFNAGVQSHYSNEEYADAGAELMRSERLFQVSDVIIKVKELLPAEYPLIRKKHAIAGFFHLPTNQGLQNLIKERELRVLAYEDVEDGNGKRPILAAMSKIAGEIAAIKGVKYLQKRNTKIRALIIGKGTAGGSAAAKLVELGLDPFDIHILDSDPKRVSYWKSPFLEREFNEYNLKTLIKETDVLIGAAAVPHKGAPKIITRETLSAMPQGGVFVDISIDEGGISETSRPTSHGSPIYTECGIVHYCVPNLPAIEPKKATDALSRAAFSHLKNFILSI